MKPVKYADVETEIEHVQPVGNQVLVKRLPDLEAPAGLTLPSSATDSDRPGIRRGVVVAVGPGDRMPDGSRLELELKPGDVVVYTRAPSLGISINGAEYQFLRYPQHTYAILEGESNA
jgi:chaperonin GroES